VTAHRRAAAADPQAASGKRQLRLPESTVIARHLDSYRRFAEAVARAVGVSVDVGGPACSVTVIGVTVTP
jgi:hypothetical protein